MLYFVDFLDFYSDSRSPDSTATTDGQLVGLWTFSFSSLWAVHSGTRKWVFLPSPSHFSPPHHERHGFPQCTATREASTPGAFQVEQLQTGVDLPIEKEIWSQESIGVVLRLWWTAKREAVNGLFKMTGVEPVAGSLPVQGGVGIPEASVQRISPMPGGFAHLPQGPRASLLSGLGILPFFLG